MKNENISSRLTMINKYDGVFITTKSKVVDQFNRHCFNAGCAYVNNSGTSNCSPVNLASVLHSPALGPSSSFQSIQEFEVLGELLKLDIHKSAGLDELDPLFLNKSAYIFASPIACIFYLSLLTGVFQRTGYLLL